MDFQTQVAAVVEMVERNPLVFPAATAALES
jgi:hypothetical protein